MKKYTLTKSERILYIGYRFCFEKEIEKFVAENNVDDMNFVLDSLLIEWLCSMDNCRSPKNIAGIAEIYSLHLKKNVSTSDLNSLIDSDEFFDKFRDRVLRKMFSPQSFLSVCRRVLDEAIEGKKSGVNDYMRLLKEYRSGKKDIIETVDESELEKATDEKKIIFNTIDLSAYGMPVSKLKAANE